MKKVLFLLMMMCIIFTGCKKDQEDKQDLEIETTSVQMEMHADHSDTDRISTTSTTSPAESADADTSTNQTSSSEKQTSTITKHAESTEISLDAGNALRKAMDEEEKAAIDAVQESEKLLYYDSKKAIRNFDKNAYVNLNIGNLTLSLPGSNNGHNVHQYFFESRSMSGTDILYLQKACEGYSGITFDADQVKSSTGASLEDSECLTYQNDSAYLELHQDGTCMMYNKKNISGILGQEVPSTLWNPLQGSQSNVSIYSGERWDDRSFMTDNQLKELIYPLNGENVSVEEASDFLYEYFTKGIASGWISSLYHTRTSTPIAVELIEYENGSYGYYFTILLRTSETFTQVDYTDKTAYLNPDRAVKGQYIQVLMLSKDSVDYICLPPTLTRSPDYTQTLPRTYCTLAEACEILSAYLSPDHVYDVHNANIFYETVFLGDLGIVQSPMWHIEVTSLTGEEAKYYTLYADIDLETKELYISYQ